MSDQQGIGMADTPGERIARLEGIQTALAEQVVDGFREVKEEMRSLSSKIDTLADVRTSHEANERAITEVRDSLRTIEGRIDSWFGDIEKDHATTKNKIAWFGGAIAVVVLFGGTFVTGFVYFLNYRFNEQQVAQQTADDEIAKNRAAIETIKDKQHQVELILARDAPNGGQP